MKHTPGPWKFNGRSKNGNHFNVVGTKLGYKFKICRCPFVGDEYPADMRETEANAKLISAAPELLDALKMLLSNDHICLEDLVYNIRESEGKGWDGPSVIEWGKAVHLAKAAIKKATE